MKIRLGGSTSTISWRTEECRGCSQKLSLGATNNWRISELIGTGGDAVQSLISEIIELRNVVKCSICLDIVKDPLQINCNHIFCADCINRLINEKPSKLICPICRKSIKRQRQKPNEIVHQLIQFVNNVIGKLEDHFQGDISALTSLNSVCHKINENARFSSDVINKFRLDESTRTFLLPEKPVDIENEIKKDAFDLLLGSPVGSCTFKKQSNHKTYTNKKNRQDIDQKLINFEDNQYRLMIIEWLCDNRNKFDRLTQTQSIIDDDSKSSVSSLDLPSMSQERSLISWCPKDKKLTSRRTRSLEVHVRQSKVKTRRNNSFSGDSGKDLENLNIEDADSDKDIPNKEQINIMQILEEKCLNIIDSQNKKAEITTEGASAMPVVLLNRLSSEYELYKDDVGKGNGKTYGLRDVESYIENNINHCYNIDEDNLSFPSKRDENAVNIAAAIDTKEEFVGKIDDLQTIYQPTETTFEDTAGDNHQSFVSRSNQVSNRTEQIARSGSIFSDKDKNEDLDVFALPTQKIIQKSNIDRVEQELRGLFSSPETIDKDESLDIDKQSFAFEEIDEVYLVLHQLTELRELGTDAIKRVHIQANSLVDQESIYIASDSSFTESMDHINFDTQTVFNMNKKNTQRKTQNTQSQKQIKKKLSFNNVEFSAKSAKVCNRNDSDVEIVEDEKTVALIEQETKLNSNHEVITDEPISNSTISFSLTPEGKSCIDNSLIKRFKRARALMEDCDDGAVKKLKKQENPYFMPQLSVEIISQAPGDVSENKPTTQNDMSPSMQMSTSLNYDEYLDRIMKTYEQSDVKTSTPKREPLATKQTKSQYIINKCNALIKEAASSLPASPPKMKLCKEFDITIDDVVQEFNLPFDETAMDKKVLQTTPKGEQNKPELLSRKNLENKNVVEDEIPFCNMASIANEFAEELQPVPFQSTTNKSPLEIKILQNVLLQNQNVNVEASKLQYNLEDEWRKMEENIEQGSQTSEEVFSDTDVDVVETTPQKDKSSTNKFFLSLSLQNRHTTNETSVNLPPTEDSPDVILATDVTSYLNKTFDPPSEFQDCNPVLTSENRDILWHLNKFDKTLVPLNDVIDIEEDSNLDNTLVNIDKEVVNKRNKQRNVEEEFNSSLTSNCKKSTAVKSKGDKREMKDLNPIERTLKSNYSPLEIVPAKSRLKKAPNLFNNVPTRQGTILNYVNSQTKSSQQSTKTMAESFRSFDKPCISCTRLSREQVIAISSLTNKRLATYSNTFNNSVTHMIVSVNEKNCIQDHTMKFISAVAAGIWILSFKWVQECLAQNKIVSEDPFEVLDVSGVPGPKTSRLMRLERPLLKGFVIHAAPPFISISKPDLENVIHMLGGKTVSTLEALGGISGIRLIVTEAKQTQDFEIYETWLERLKVVTVDVEWLSRSVGQFQLLSLKPFSLCSDDNIADLGYPEELLVDTPFSFSQSMYKKNYGGQHQRQYPHPAGHGSRLPPGRQDRLRDEGAVPLLPVDRGEAPQGRHPGNLRGGNYRRPCQPRVPRTLQEDAGRNRTPFNAARRRPTGEERRSDSVRYATNTSRAVDDRAFIPREVRDLIREKNRLRRQWQRTLNPASKAEYNRMARRTKVALDEFLNNRWGDFMVRASETPSEFWRAVKALKGQRVPVPPIHGARGVAFTTEDKAEAFAETLERQCSPVYENVDRIRRIHRQVRDLLTAEENDEEPIRPTSPEEVKAIVKSFRPTKAPGPEGVTYRALKHAPKKFVMHMINICNAMLRLRHFPSQWKLADVAMIPKPGQSHNWPQNYRPFSLLPVMSKIADRIILARLREETDDLDVIPGCQFGFRREHSTIHQVLRLVEHIKEGFNRRECTGAVFLDVAKAFDKVWHEVLLLKMHRPGISSTTLLQVSQRQSDRPTSPAFDTAGLVRKVENHRPSPEKHGRAFRDKRSPKKEVRQRAGSHLPRRHHSLAT
ncbi:hypothetical protein Trydic_g23016 [Trypoxylus dichotomus]